MSSIRLNNLKKLYDNAPVFDGLSLEIKKNSLCLITGESGCGKTTLLRMISGLERDFEGEISGISPTDCAFVFQEYRLFPTLNAIENVCLGAKGDKNELKKAAEELLFEFGFSKEDTEKYPHELSGGMKQRVSLARAFISEKPLLLLDEPTKELDQKLRHILYQKIKSVIGKRTVIMVTHLTDDIKEFSDCIIDLSKTK